MNEKQNTERYKKVALIAPYKGNSKAQKASSTASKGNVAGTDLSENEKLKVRAERFKAHLNTKTPETSTTKQRYTKSQTSFTATVKTGFTPSKQQRKLPRDGFQSQTRRKREERCENVLSKVEERIRRRKERSALPPENLLIKVTVRTQNEGYLTEERDDYEDTDELPYRDNSQHREEDWCPGSPVIQAQYYESDQSDYIDSPRSDTPSEWSYPAYEPIPFGETMVRRSDSDKDLKGGHSGQRFDKDSEFHSDLYEERARTPERFHKRFGPYRGMSEKFGSTEEFMDNSVNRSEDRALTPERFRNRLDHSDPERLQTPERLRKRMNPSPRRRERTETTVYHRERSETTVHHKERIKMSVRHRDRIESPERSKDRRRSPLRSRARSGISDSSRDASPEYSPREHRRSRREEFARDLPTPPRRLARPERPYSTPEKVKVNQSSSKRIRDKLSGSYSFRRRMVNQEETYSRDLKKCDKLQPVTRSDIYEVNEQTLSESRYRPGLQPTELSRNRNLQEKYDPMEPTLEEYEDRNPRRELPGLGRPLGNTARDQVYRMMIPPGSLQRNRFQEVGLAGLRDPEAIKQPNEVLPPNTFDYGHGLQRTPTQLKTNLVSKSFPSPQVFGSGPLSNRNPDGRGHWMASDLDLQQTTGSRNDPLNLYPNPSAKLPTANVGSISQYKAGSMQEVNPYKSMRPSLSVQYPGNLGTRIWPNGSDQEFRGQPDGYRGQRSSPERRAIDRPLERRPNMDDSFEERARLQTRALRQTRFDRSRSRSRSRERERSGNLRDRTDVERKLPRYQPRERGKY